MQDHAGILEMLDSKFKGIGIFGTVYDKFSFVNDSVRKTQFRNVQLRKIGIVEEAGFSLSVTDVEVDVTLDSTIISGMLRISRTWVQRGSSWKMLSFHLTDTRLGRAWDKTKAARDIKPTLEN